MAKSEPSMEEAGELEKVLDKKSSNYVTEAIGGIRQE